MAPCGRAASGSNVLSRSLLPGVTPPRHPGPDTQSKHDDHDHADQRPRANFSDVLRDLFAQKVRKPDVHADPADASDECAEHKDVKPHPENSRHKSRHSHGCREGMTAEGTVAL